MSTIPHSERNKICVNYVTQHFHEKIKELLCDLVYLIWSQKKVLYLSHIFQI